MMERYLIVGLHGTPLPAVGGPANEFDLYGAFVEVAEALGFAFSRLDVKGPRAVQWGMNDAEFVVDDSHFAWVQVAPVTGKHDRFPMLGAAVSLWLAVEALTGAGATGVHAVTQVEEFTDRERLSTWVLPDMGEGHDSRVKVRVDAFVETSAEAFSEALTALPNGCVSSVVSAVAFDGPVDKRPPGLWRIYSDPALQMATGPRRFDLELTIRGDRFIHLPAAIESIFSTLIDIGAVGPAHVGVTFSSE